MNWAGAIERNSEALKAIVAALLAMLGSVTEARIPRDLHSSVLRVLRPAEAAMRRLIVTAARGVVVKPANVCSRPKELRRGDIYMGMRHAPITMI